MIFIMRENMLPYTKMMNWKDVSIAFVLMLIIAAIIGALVVLHSKKKRWSCKENRCEEDIDGNFSTKAQCEESCQKEA